MNFLDRTVDLVKEIQKSKKENNFYHWPNLFYLEKHMYCSAAASGWAGWAKAHPEFGSSVNPITTRGADYTHHITASPPGL